MSVAPTQCCLLALTMRKSDLEYSLLQITATISRMSAKSSALHQELLSQVQTKVNPVLTGEGSKDIDVEIEKFYTSEFYTAYQAQTAMINRKERDLDVQKQQMETQLNAINTLIDGVEKQLDSFT